ncbi:MAG: carbohydrate-binding protein [Verrucomicrobiota bacterium]|nr:carbohydrate-binding protein [Verrucomicrobiota bacterium]
MALIPVATSAMTLQCEDYRAGSNAPGGADTDYTTCSYYDTTAGSESSVDYAGRNADGDDIDFGGLADGNRAVSYIAAGEWFYMSGNTASRWDSNPTFPKRDRYRITARVASANDAKYFKIYIDGTLEATVPVPNTGGTGRANYQLTSSVITTNVIAAGLHSVKFDAGPGGYNIDRISFEAISEPTTASLLGAEIGESVSGGLKVGFGQVDITPPVGSILTGPHLPVSVGMEDPLFAKALVAQSGDQTLAIVQVDLVKILRYLADEAIAQAVRRTGIDSNAVMICASHNHSSPLIPVLEDPDLNTEYLSTLPGLIADSIEQAYKALQPARMYMGRSLVYEGHHNRRVISKADGLALNTWLGKLNDLKQTPQVLGTEGPIDPELWVARFDALDGQVLGTLVNFACHPNHRQRDLLKTWSSDFPGVIAEQIAQEYGEQAVCVFTQGCSGNINPTVQCTPDWRRRVMVFADAAVRAAKQAIPVDGPIAVGYARRDVTVPRCDPEAERKGAIERLGWRPDMFVAMQREVVRMPRHIEVPVNAGRIGPLGIASNAGELFVELGLSIKKRSPFPHTIVSELTNEWVGYEPTAHAFQHEGYETLAGVNLVSSEGIQTLVDTVVELLQELWEEDSR